MNKIKEKLLKEIEEPKKDIDYWVRYWRRMQERGCNNFYEYLRIYEETSKAKDEEFGCGGNFKILSYDEAIKKMKEDYSENELKKFKERYAPSKTQGVQK